MKTKDELNPKKPKNYLEIIAQIMVVAVLAQFIITLFFDPFQMSGSSMNPQIQKEDYVLINRAAYMIDQPDRFELVYIDLGDGHYTIKRIVGLPGETIYISEGLIYINSNELKNDFASDQIINGGIASSPLTLKEDEYFVLGDNSAFSEDSRSKNVGVIKYEQFHGKPWCVVFPLNRMSTIH